MFATDQLAMKAFVDLAWTMGSEHNITGVNYPQVLMFYMAAMETAKFYDYHPEHTFPDPTVSENEPEHRQLQWSPTSSWGSSCPLRQCCATGTCGMSGGCSGSECRGMCGPGCTCWNNVQLNPRFPFVNVG